jgi:uncharacterized protein with NRDE domain
MCTILLAYKKIPGWPLVVANNRDEFFQRRALPPRVYRAHNNPGLSWLASCDLSGGGSWWGYNNRGLMVWLTNCWTGSESASGLRSRGDLVTELLACDDLLKARQYLENVCDGQTFNPFNLIIATRENAFLATNSPDLEFAPLNAGYHYLGNGSIVDRTSVKAANALNLFSGFTGAETLSEILEIMCKALRTPLPDDSIPPQGFNVTFEGYGTTSSLLLALAEKEALQLQYCAENPRVGSYQDYSRLALLL